MSRHKTAYEDMQDKEYHIYAQGKLRGSKVIYDQSECCTVWHPMKDTDKIEDEESGICFDFSAEQTEDLISLLQEMKENEADIYEPDPEEEKKRKEWEKKQETLLEKIKSAFEDIGIHCTPFYWTTRKLMVTRPKPSGKDGNLVHKLCSGIYLGPLCITWGREWGDVVKSFFKKP